MTQSLLDPEEFAELDPGQMLHWLDANRPPSYHPVFSHGDFRPKNIIKNGNGPPGLIDWEHSIWCSPYYDISVFYYDLTSEERGAFAQVYGTGVLEEDLLKYFDRLSKFLNVASPRGLLIEDASNKSLELTP